MLTSKDYWQGWNDGHKHTKEESIRVFVERMESLKEVKGIGPILYNRIIDHVNKEGEYNER